MTEDWDKRERISEERRDDWTKRIELLDVYVPLVKEYARLNDIELPPDDHDEYSNFVYGFVWDAKFINFAFDRSGILFNERMFTLPITKEDRKLLEKSGIEFVNSNK
jgi:hypothetical protein